MTAIYRNRKLVIDPGLYLPAGYTHAATPTAIHLNDGIHRIFFNARDTQNKSHVFSCDLDYEDDFKMLRMDKTPIFSPGELGSFDDSGVSIGNIANISGKYYLYYMGWNLGVTVPWRNFIGIAEYDLARNTFIRLRKSPLVDRSEIDPFSMSYPFVLNESNDQFKMWYGSNLRWDTTKRDIDHIIKYCDSTDGFSWNREGKLALKMIEGINAYCRPSVLKINNTYRMWYCFRAEKYKIGSAVSKDGINWDLDSVFLEPKMNNDWDGTETCYPYVHIYKDKLFCLYCGNNYGKTGVGICEVEL